MADSLIPDFKSHTDGKGPKADNLISLPNDLEESLKDLEAYEKVAKTELTFNSPTGDRMVKVKHEVADQLPEPYKSPTPMVEEDTKLDNVRQNEGEKYSPKVLEQITKTHKDAPNSAYTDLPLSTKAAILEDFESLMKVAGNPLTDQYNERFNTEKHPSMKFDPARDVKPQNSGDFEKMQGEKLKNKSPHGESWAPRGIKPDGPPMQAPADAIIPHTNPQKGLPFSRVTNPLDPTTQQNLEHSSGAEFLPPSAGVSQEDIDYGKTQSPRFNTNMDLSHIDKTSPYANRIVSLNSAKELFKKVLDSLE